MSCVDASTGNYITFNETQQDLVKAVVSSASIAFVFPDQVWSDGVVCVDGGTGWQLNLVSAAERCREQVDDDS